MMTRFVPVASPRHGCDGRGLLELLANEPTESRPCICGADVSSAAMRTRTSAPHWRYSLLISLLVLCLPLMGAEKTELEMAEDAEAAEEERILEQLGRLPDDGHEFTAAGRLVLAAQAMDENRPSVLGIFTAYKRTYQVKLEDESLRKKLAKFNGKTVTLAGKIRNKGKYLIVQAVLTQPGKFRAVSGRRGRGRM